MWSYSIDLFQYKQLVYPKKLSLCVANIQSFEKKKNVLKCRSLFFAPFCLFEGDETNGRAD